MPAFAPPTFGQVRVDRVAEALRRDARAVVDAGGVEAARRTRVTFDAPGVVDAAVGEPPVDPGDARRLEGRADGRRDVAPAGTTGRATGRSPLRSPRQTPSRSKRDVLERHAAALLEAAVGLRLDEVRRRDAHLAAVERPPAERVGHVLPAELEAEPAVRRSAGPRRSRTSGRPGPREAGDEAAVAASGRPRRRWRRSRRRTGGARGTRARRPVGSPVGCVEEVVGADAERRREPAPREDRLAGGRAHVVELRGRVARDLGVDGASRARRQDRRAAGYANTTTNASVGAARHA